MPNILKVTADNPDELLNAGAYDAGALIRVQSAAVAGGPFSDLSGAGSTPTLTIVSGTTSYTAYDPAGGSSTWYRTRYENASTTRASDWTEPFQVGRKLYAGLDDLKEYLQPIGDDKDNLLLDLLEEATSAISDFCERDFFRHPQTGEEVRLFRGNGTRRLRVKAGIISLSQVRLASSTGQPYSTLDVASWALGPERLSSEPAEWVWLSEAAPEFTSWTDGLDTVELTGQFGWPQVPVLIRKATIDLAREWYRQGPGGSLAAVPGQFRVFADPRTGMALPGTGLPPSVRDAIERYSARGVIH